MDAAAPARPSRVFTCPRGGRRVAGQSVVMAWRLDGRPATTAIPQRATAATRVAGSKDGWVCPPGAACLRTVCGDGKREGSEDCDDSNARPYDGCSSTCQKEPRCGTDTSAVGECVAACGDGILLAVAGEACDDGNALTGDGCDASCKLEPGHRCTTLADDPPEFIDLPIVIRDFRRFESWMGPGNTNPVGHPDFGVLCCTHQTGIVQSLLGSDRKPVYTGSDAAPINMTTGKTYFDQWYRDVVGINQRVDRSLRLARQANGAYVMDSARDEPWATLGGFLPIDTLGFGNENLQHNYLFTSELRYWFEFGGNEVLNFSGDGRLWVFHQRQAGHRLGWCSRSHLRHGSARAERSRGELRRTGLLAHGRRRFRSRRGSHLRGGSAASRALWRRLELLAHAHELPGQEKPVCAGVRDAVVTPDEACDLGTAAKHRRTRHVQRRLHAPAVSAVTGTSMLARRATMAPTRACTVAALRLRFRVRNVATAWFKRRSRSAMTA